MSLSHIVRLEGGGVLWICSLGLGGIERRKRDNGCNIMSTNNNELPIIDYFGGGRIALGKQVRFI